ncbi:MAG TPA: KTSC domain-containing protein [Burkholderiales bacterium]|nr:KTSC domain-containing protein [Burkholderiales bacterium]
MERKRVSASNIRSVGYDASSQTLEVEFFSGSIVQYSRVSPEVHRRLMNAPSPGSYFKDNIEEEYTARRLR